jgi:6,7-dimethyl-8-ribityllumazine synthase
MSGEGRPELETESGEGLHIVIVSGLWHNTIAAGLLGGARRELEKSGARWTEVQVPGSFELPVAAKAALDAGADAVVALGVIVRGETPHFDFVASAATDGLTRVALDSGKPVGFGVLTVDTEQQGLDRAGLPDSKEDVGGRAAEAAIATLHAIRSLKDGQGSPSGR